MIGNCRGCRSADLREVLDLGNQRLSDFRDDGHVPPAYPLQVLLCQACTLVQLGETTPRDLMYHDRYGFRSGVNEAIRADLASIVDYALAAESEPRAWLDIASNDGTLLSMVPKSVYRVGVDPVRAFADEARQHANWIVSDYFDPEYFFNTRRFDVITSISMFYDVDDPGKFVAQVADRLAHDGVWVIQQNYVLSMLEQNAFDNISHEHITYYSLRALEDLLGCHGLEVVDVALSPVNGGCIRTLVAHAGRRTATLAVQEQRDRESAARLDDPATFADFATRSLSLLADLRETVQRVNDSGGKVYVLGASTRGGTILQAAGLGPAHLPFAVERQPAKVGKVWSATGIPIISEEQARADRPAAMLVSPWFFRDVFLDREADYLASGGQLIFPLPHLEVVGGPR